MGDGSTSHTNRYHLCILQVLVVTASAAPVLVAPVQEVQEAPAGLELRFAQMESRIKQLERTVQRLTPGQECTARYPNFQGEDELVMAYRGCDADVKKVLPDVTNISCQNGKLLYAPVPSTCLIPLAQVRFRSTIRIRPNKLASSTSTSMWKTTTRMFTTLCAHSLKISHTRPSVTWQCTRIISQTLLITLMVLRGSTCFSEACSPQRIVCLNRLQSLGHTSGTSRRTRPGCIHSMLIELPTLLSDDCMMHE